MGHGLQIRTVGLAHEAKCAQRGCGYFLQEVNTDTSRIEFANKAKHGYAIWHASAPRKVVPGG